MKKPHSTFPGLSQFYCDTCQGEITSAHTMRVEVADGQTLYYHGLPSYVQHCASITPPDRRVTFAVLLTGQYLANILEPAAEAYVESLFPDAWATKERDGWFIRTNVFRNYLGKHASAPGQAWVDAARFLSKTEGEGRLAEVVANSYRY